MLNKFTPCASSEQKRTLFVMVKTSITVVFVVVIVVLFFSFCFLRENGRKDEIEAGRLLTCVDCYSYAASQHRRTIKIFLFNLTKCSAACAPQIKNQKVHTPRYLVWKGVNDALALTLHTTHYTVHCTARYVLASEFATTADALIVSSSCRLQQMCTTK